MSTDELWMSLHSLFNYLFKLTEFLEFDIRQSTFVLLWGLTFVFFICYYFIKRKIYYGSNHYLSDLR